MPAALSRCHRLLLLPLVSLFFHLCSQTQGSSEAAASLRRPSGAKLIRNINAAPRPTSTLSGSFRRILQTTSFFSPPPPPPSDDYAPTPDEYAPSPDDYAPSPPGRPPPPPPEGYTPSPPPDNDTPSPPPDVYTPPSPSPYPAPSLHSKGLGPNSAEGKPVNIGLVVGISSVCVVVTMILVAFIVCWWKRTRKTPHPAELAFADKSVPVMSMATPERPLVIDHPNAEHPPMKPAVVASAPTVKYFFEENSKAAKEFAYTQLADATQNFSCMLGEGGFGSVYKGDLNLLSGLDAGNGGQRSLVAIKRMSHGSKQGLREFMSEIMVITRLRHRNLVNLHGWCLHDEELLLVYEFMPNGSLDTHLFGSDVSYKAPLDWGVRYNIVKGLASALYYLHEQCDSCVLHRDIKSSNVLLDDEFNAKLGDFGLARLMDHDQTFYSTLPAGTLGYLAPECLKTGRPQRESDVYSFGVVVLEIVCGRTPSFEPRAGEKRGRVHLVDWVRELFDCDKVLDAVDPRLRESYSFSENDNREIKRLILVGLWCAYPDSGMRPSMKKVNSILDVDEELKLPMDHPLNVPVTMRKPGPDGASIDTSTLYGDKQAPEMAESFSGHATRTDDAFYVSITTPPPPTTR